MNSQMIWSLASCAMSKCKTFLQSTPMIQAFPVNILCSTLTFARGNKIPTFSFEANSALNLVVGAGFEVDLGATGGGSGDRRRSDERRGVEVRMMITHFLLQLRFQ
nr:hypothetical protein Iba_chr11bCG4050 [Ipomoea batatas]